MERKEGTVVPFLFQPMTGRIGRESSLNNSLGVEVKNDKPSLQRPVLHISQLFWCEMGGGRVGRFGTLSVEEIRMQWESYTIKG